MDETIIHNFGVPLKIVARFYSSNLVEYLVNELHMPTSNIKCRITTEKAPKPDTFHDFLLYIFKMFLKLRQRSWPTVLSVSLYLP